MPLEDEQEENYLQKDTGDETGCCRGLYMLKTKPSNPAVGLS